MEGLTAAAGLTMARRIPIRNLYYLLCYAWDVLEERDDALVSELDGLSHVELLAKVLSVSVQRLWKRGLDRGLTATGIDLTKDWRTIHQRLLDIVANA